MESGDWGAQLQRQTIVSKIMDILKKYLPFSGYERLQKLKKIAERVEQEIYTDATGQSEYARKICLMMLTMETRLQNPMLDPMQSSSAAFSVNPLVPIDTTTQTNNPNGGDCQEEVYQKVLYHHKML
ncbi:putative coactivator CBP, KIX domain superfamily, mediator complex subunit 15, KIX [Helianthus anomalus]